MIIELDKNVFGVELLQKKLIVAMFLISKIEFKVHSFTMGI